MLIKKDLIFNIYNKIIMSRFQNRRWLVIPTAITGSINFNEVIQNNAENLRLSVDKSETFVKYEITEVTESFTETHIDVEGNEFTSSIEAGIYGRPSFYKSEYKEYNHAEILDLLITPDWSRVSEDNSI